MKTYQCPNCGGIYYSAASQEELISRECICGGMVEEVG
jgi:rubredoxin